MAEDGGARVRILALHEVEIAVAETSSDRLDQHFARTGLADLDVLDVELARNRVEDSSLH